MKNEQAAGKSWARIVSRGAAAFRAFAEAVTPSHAPGEDVIFTGAAAR